MGSVVGNDANKVCPTGKPFNVSINIESIAPQVSQLLNSEIHADFHKLNSKRQSNVYSAYEHATNRKITFKRNQKYPPKLKFECVPEEVFP